MIQEQQPKLLIERVRLLCLLNFMVHISVSKRRVDSIKVQFFQSDFQPYCKPHRFLLLTFFRILDVEKMIS